MATPWLETTKPSAWFIVGDVREVLRSLPDNSVDMVLSSPPFFALRSYLPTDHEDKHREIGAEPTPADFIDVVLDVAEECARVLTPTGSLCFELGDTYAGSGGARGDYAKDGLREGQPAFMGSSKRMGNNRNDKVAMAAQGIIGTTSGERARANPQAFALPKSLSLIPESFRWALAYGRNPFNGRETDRWRVRNVVRWHRPNPPVGALGDKFRPATSEMVVACKSTKRWFDLDAVRTEHKEQIRTNIPRTKPLRGDLESEGGDKRGYVLSSGNEAGAPPLDTWTIPTQSYKGSHYATWPEELCRIPILSMCPKEVCRTCGEPRRRTVDAESLGEKEAKDRARDKYRLGGSAGGIGNTELHRMRRTTTGWSDCGHDDYRPGVVLDPFGGSGTTAKEALAHGRSGVLIDIDKRNFDLAADRVGFWLQEWSA